MPATLMPQLWFTGLDPAGVTLPGSLLFTYDSGTVNKTVVYQDADMTVPHANPIVLDSAARAVVYFPANSIKVVWAPANDTDPPVSPYKTVDPVVSSAAAGPLDVNIIGTAGEDLRVSDAVYLSDGQGGRTPGQWYRATASLAYASTEAEAIGIAPVLIPSGTTGNIVITGRATYNRSALAAGSLYYLEVGTSPATEGRLTATPPANARAVGIADSASSIIMSQFVPIVNASATVAGAVSIAAQTFAGDKTWTGASLFNFPPTFRPGASTGAYIPVSGRLTTNTTPVGNVGTGEDDLMTFSVPIDTLDTNGKALRFTAWGTGANNAAAKVVKAYFGATLIGTLNIAVSSARVWRLTGEIIRTSLTAQIAATCGFDATGTTFLSTEAFLTNAAPAETLSAAITFKLTGTATTTNDIVQSALILETVG